MASMSKATEQHFFVVLAGMQRVEIGDPVDAEDHGFAINHEALPPVLQDSLKEIAWSGHIRCG